MSLTNTQYDAIMRTYDAKRNKAVSDAGDRLAELYQKLPEYEALSRQIASLGSSAVSSLLHAETADDTADEIRDRIRILSDKKRTLLKEAGYPEDYTEPRYECSECNDTGFLPDHSKCRCFKQQEIRLLYEQSNLGHILAGDNFSNLSYEYYEGEDLERFRSAVDKCRSFIENFPKDYENILFCGTVGTGKSFLSGCIARELLDHGFSVIYFSAAELFSLLSDIMFRHGDAEALRHERSELYSCDLLIIDDLGTELTNSATATQLFTVLNERFLKAKATIISTNMSLQELQETYADRIFSRLMERYSFIRLTGPDIRRLKANKS